MSLISENHMPNVFEEYLSSVIKDCDVLDFWKAQSSDARYARLTQMARDYLLQLASNQCI